MSLKDKQFSVLYRKKDDVLHNFYIPALSEATSYKRVSAYFSADVLKLYAKGLSSFVANNGKIQFVFSHHITKEDFDLIKKGYDGRFNRELLNAIDELDDSVLTSNLAYLIANNIVEIKIGFMVPGTLHFKYGLISDVENTVCFRGSTNETPAGLLLNGENFEVSCSWLASAQEKQVIEGYENDFNDLWNGNYAGVVTVDAPNCVIDKIESFNKHNLILDYDDQCLNAFILDFDSNHKLVGYSFLTNRELLSPTGLFYKMKLSSFVERVTNLSIFNFRELMPSEIRKVISVLEDSAKKDGYTLKVSPRVTSYLNSLEMYLNKRKSLGGAIKNKDESVLAEFDKFKNVVNQELTRTLAEPQMWDAFHAVEMVAASNFSVPGTGKTTIAYAAYGYLSSEAGGRKVKRVVMIGPKNSFMAWKREFKLCFGNKRPLRCFNAQDPKFKTTGQMKASLMQEYQNSNLVLINYDKLQNQEVTDLLINLMKKGNFSDYLIMDEAHKIKACNGKRAAAAKSLATYAKYKLILTGTPIPNSYQDIYNILNILYPNDYSLFFGYTPDELQMITYYPSKQDEINSKLYPFFCRTTKKDLRVPPATFDYETGQISMDEREQTLFSLIRQKYYGNTLVLYTRLLQASIYPTAILAKLKKDDVLAAIGMADDDDDNDDKTSFSKYKPDIYEPSNLFSPEEAEFIKSFGKTRKFYRGIDIIEEHAEAGESVVAWGVFVNTLKIIHEELEERGISSVVISGSMPLDERERCIDAFMDGKFQVLISNPHTLGESVSLHKKCHCAVYFEYTFNLTHMLQSRDRIHRFGLPDNTKTLYYFLSIESNDLFSDSIDTRTLQRLQAKEATMLEAVEGQQLFVKDSSFQEDLDFIFGLNKNSQN